MIRLGITASGLYIAPDPDANAYIAAMTVPPSPERQDLIQSLFRGLKASGLWLKIDWLTLLASHTSQAGLLNARYPAKTASVSGPMVFTTDRGFSGSLSGTTYLTSGEVLNASGNVYALNSGFLYGYINQVDEADGMGQSVGTFPLGNSYLGVGTGSNNIGYRLNTPSQNNITVSPVPGGYLATRTASNATTLYKAGAQIATTADASTSVSASNASALYRTSSRANDRIAIWAYGGGLTGVEAHSFNTIMTTYLTAIGAN